MGLDYTPAVPMDLDGAVSAPSVSLPAAAKQDAILNPDFVMNKNRTEVRKASPVKMASQQDRNWMPAAIVTENVEFRSRKEQDKLMEGRKARIGDLTNQILSMHVDQMKKYKRAKKRLEGLSKDDEEHPSDRTIKDRKIVRRGPPITKREAQDQAYEQLVKFGW